MSNSTTSSKNADDEESFKYKIISMILTIIIIVGLIGNLLNIIVFSKRNMRQASTFRFLLYLSIADLLVLAVCATDALARFGFQFEIRSYSIIICRVHTFLTYFLTHISSVILMVISVDRALVVTNKSILTLFSNKKAQNLAGSASKKQKSKIKYEEEHLNETIHSCRDFSTLKTKRKVTFFYSITKNLHRVDFVIGLIMLILTLLNSHYFIFLDLNLMSESANSKKDESINPYAVTDSIENTASKQSEQVQNTSTLNEDYYICFPLEGTVYNYFLNNVWIWIDICVYSLIPFIIMSICSLIILARIRSKSKKYFTKLINKNNQFYKTNFYKRLRRNRQLLYMLLITNLYFLLSLLPYCITFVLFKGQKGENPLGQLSVHILLYTNNAVNFLFYGLSSQKYRQELYTIFFKSK